MLEADLGGAPFLGENLVAHIGNHWSMTGAGPHLWKFLDPPVDVVGVPIRQLSIQVTICKSQPL